MNIGYDLLTWEGDILRLQFWAHAFEYLKKTGSVFLQTRGQARGLLGDEDRGRRRSRGDAAARGSGRAGRGAGAPGRGTEGEGHRPFRRHRDLRRQGHGLPDVEVRLARPRLPLPDFRGRSAPALVHDLGSGGGAARSPVLRTRRAGVQRHRHAPGVPAEAAEAGAGRARLPRAGGPLDPLLLRDGGADARDRARAGLRPRRRRGKPFVEVSGRKGLGVKADDLLDRLRDKAAAEVARRNTELAPRATRSRSPSRSPSRRSATSWSSSRAAR